MPFFTLSGGRFPSDMAIRKTGTMSTSNDGTVSSEEDDTNVIAAAGAMPGSAQRDFGDKDPYHMEGVRSGSALDNHPTDERPLYNYSQQPTTTTSPVQTQTFALPNDPQQPVNQQQQSFLGSEPANTSAAAPQSLAQSEVRPDSQYGDWMAPTAAGVAGVGAGALGAEAYQRHQRDADVPVTNDPQANNVAHGSNQLASSTLSPVSDASSAGALSDSTTATEPAASGPASIDNVAAMPLGGLEKTGAHETGEFFPRVIRHDTNISISKLHVPGEFPKKS